MTEEEKNGIMDRVLDGIKLLFFKPEDAEEPETEPEKAPDPDAPEDERRPSPFEGIGDRVKGLFGKKDPKKKERSKALKAKPEKDPDPDSLSERYRRWKLIKNEGYVILKVLTRDSNGEYWLETTLVKFEDLPKEAVAVTGEKNTYCVDKIKTSKWYLETHVDPHADYYESQFTASDACLYMTSNKIDNALTINWTEYSHIDPKRYIWLIIAVLVVLIVLIWRLT